jgi:hypothetical protein
MTSNFESPTSTRTETEAARPSGWLRLGVIAAASVLVGGLAAAWWYRKTLTTFRQAGENGSNPHFGIPADDPADEA